MFDCRRCEVVKADGRYFLPYFGTHEWLCAACARWFAEEYGGAELQPGRRQQAIGLAVSALPPPLPPQMRPMNPYQFARQYQQRPAPADVDWDDEPTEPGCRGCVHVPSGDCLHTATGDDLDRLARMFGIDRAPSEADSQLRDVALEILRDRGPGRPT